jgi:hypothetical protein
MKSKGKFFGFIAMLWFILTGAGTIIFAQSGLKMSVSGYVRDVNTDIPIPGVEVLLFDMKQANGIKVYSGTSNSVGFYKIRYLAAGEYEFSVINPAIGFIHIETITQGGEHINPYSFKIEEGINKILNVYMGEYDYPLIKTSTSLDLTRIDFTMLYVKRQVQSRSAIADASAVIYKECNGLTWIFNTDVIEIEDDEYIIYPPPKDAVDFGGFAREYQFQKFKAECKDDLCEYPDFKLIVDSCIVIHKTSFYEKIFNLPAKCAACYQQCTLNHENAHVNSFFPIACEEWINFLDKFDTLPCCKNGDCKDQFYEHYGKFIKNINSKVNEEHKVLVVKDKECRASCLKKCDK